VAVSGPRRRLSALVAGLLALPLVAVGCRAAVSPVRPGVVRAVGAENEYADVIAQIGGRYVSVAAVESNPNTDPHTFEASPAVAQEVANAQLVVQNGLGYDPYMSTIEAAEPNSAREVIDVQHLLHLPDSTPNPHLWYSPRTMPAVAAAVAAALADLQPAHRSYFEARVRAFDAALRPWLTALNEVRASYPGAAVATTEPVADDLLSAAGLRNLTPFSLQAAVMNGVDLSPQQVTLADSLLSAHKVKVFVYNQQVVDSVTENFLALAHQHGVPVVGAYETMPTPGYHYQTWMLAETQALLRALRTGASTQRL
jgi:zinc/manganese transport system substrate-binding protein